jgi:hypothetical protein
VTGLRGDQAGSALLAVLLGLTLLCFIGATAASLAALSRRSARGALDAVAGEAAVDEGLSAIQLPVPGAPGSTFEVGLSPPPPTGWVGDRELTRLSGGLVLVRVTVERGAREGAIVARSEGMSLWQISDSGQLALVPGGWVADP